MPATFNPNLPATNSPNSSAEMRSQLNALQDQITAQQGQITTLQNQVAWLQTQVGTLAARPTVGPFTDPLDDPPTTANLAAVVGTLNQLIGELEPH